MCCIDSLSTVKSIALCFKLRPQAIKWPWQFEPIRDWDVIFNWIEAMEKLVPGYLGIDSDLIEPISENPL
jgi:hypothetical protein